MLLTLSFSRYLKSHQSKKLSNSFRLNVKIWGRDHLEYKLARGYRLPVYGTNSYITPKNKYEYGILHTPIGIEEDEYIFQNKCLPIAIILAYHHHISEENGHGSEQQKKFAKLSRKKTASSNILLKAGGNLMHQEVTSLLTSLDLPVEGPYLLHEIIPKIADHLNVQISIFNPQNEAFRTYMYPTEFDKTRRQLFLQEEDIENTNEKHVNVITLIRTFFLRHKFVCPACKKMLKSKQFRHLCRNKRSGESCFSCRKFVKTTDTKWHKGNEFLFCKCIAGDKDEKFVCPRCACYAPSPECLEDHLKMCGKTIKGYKCEKGCGKWTYTNSVYPTTESLKKSHICNLYVYNLHQRHLFLKPISCLI